jgi:hypothetical protein
VGVRKLSNIGGWTSKTSYTSMLAGNPVFIPSAYDSIATVFYSSGTGGDVTFSNIPSGYRNLQLRMFLRDTRSASDSTWFMQFNGDTGNNYSYQGMSSNGTSISNVSSINTNSMQGITSASSTGGSRFGAAVIDIFDSNQTNKFKTATYQSGYTNNGSGNLYTLAGSWRSTAAINSIVIKPNTGFAQYSHFALYGMV